MNVLRTLVAVPGYDVRRFWCAGSDNDSRLFNDRRRRRDNDNRE